jgi:hypothetical protein
MFPFGDPEWQLHIPAEGVHHNRSHTPLLHVYLSGPVVGSQGALAAGPLLSAPESGNGASGVAAEQAFVPARGILSQKVRLEQERSCIIYGYISANSS